MRVTHGMVSQRLLGDLRESYTRLSEAQRQAATGRRVNQASDDPVAARQAVLRRSELESIEANRQGITAARTWIESTDSSLGRMHDIVHRARELTLRAANGSLSAGQRATVALEIDALAEAAKDAANASVNGQYLFAGTATTTKPYAVGSDTYAGDSGTVARGVGPGVSVSINVRASDLLGSGQVAADGRLLHTLRDIADHMRSSSTTALDALRTTDLQALDANLDGISVARAVAGSTQNRLEAASTRLDDLAEAGTRVLGDLEELDLAEALTRYSVQQNAYQAVLRSGASIIQPSLMDFLR